MENSDSEIRELKERLATLEQKSPTKPSASITTIKVVATLIALGIGGFLILAAIGTALPKETARQKLDKIEQQVEAACDLKWTKTEEASQECKAREYAARAPQAFR